MSRGSAPKRHHETAASGTGELRRERALALEPLDQPMRLARHQLPAQEAALRQLHAQGEGLQPVGLEAAGIKRQTLEREPRGLGHLLVELDGAKRLVLTERLHAIHALAGARAQTGVVEG